MRLADLTEPGIVQDVFIAQYQSNQGVFKLSEGIIEECYISVWEGVLVQSTVDFKQYWYPSAGGSWLCGTDFPPEVSICIGAYCSDGQINSFNATFLSQTNVTTSVQGNNINTLYQLINCQTIPSASSTPSPTQLEQSASNTPYEPSSSSTPFMGLYDCCIYYDCEMQFATEFCSLQNLQCPEFLQYVLVGISTVTSCSLCSAQNQGKNLTGAINS